MRICPGIACVLLFCVLTPTEGSCPANANALKMCYEGTRSGTDVYLETTLPSDNLVTECSCTVTTFGSGTDSAQVDFIPKQNWLSCYYKQIITFKGATATYSCDNPSNRVTTFFDMIDNSTATVSLQESFKSGVTSLDTCLQIRAFTNNVILKVNCFKVLSMTTETTKQQVTTTTVPTTKQVSTTKLVPTITQQAPTTTQVPSTTQVPTTTQVSTNTQQVPSTTQPTTTQQVPTTTQQLLTTAQQKITTTQQVPPTTQQLPTTTQQENKQQDLTTKHHDLNTRKTTVVQKTGNGGSVSEVDGRYLPGEITKPRQDMVVPIGLGVGTFLILFAGIIVFVCNKCSRQRNDESDVENDILVTNSDETPKGLSSPLDPNEGTWAEPRTSANTQDVTANVSQENKTENGVSYENVVPDNVVPDTDNVLSDNDNEIPDNDEDNTFPPPPVNIFTIENN